MKNILPAINLYLCLVAMLTGLIDACCQDNLPPHPQRSDEISAIIFRDPMTDRWQNNWFLDGKKATLVHDQQGLHFTAATKEGIWEARNQSAKMREVFDSMHAVLWTKQEFTGEVGISFELTRTSPGFTILIYLLAQGIGTPPYSEDISKWSELREIPVMSKYFRHMNLTSITFRESIRLRRYPLMDDKGERFTDTLIGNQMIDYDPLPIGKHYKVEIELRTETIRLRLEEIGNPVNLIDITRERNKGLDPRRPQASSKGRIGIRQMTGTSAHYRNFQVRQL